VEAARAAGFDVTLGDAVEWLNAREGKLDALFSSNVVEHLPPETVAEWLRAAQRALRPGGMLLFSTPNPESAIVHLYEFWRDPTHVRLYNRQLLEFMLSDAGFEAIQSQPNAASAWEGADAMLAGVADPLPPITLPDAPATVPELPAGLGDDFPPHKRLLWRLLKPLYSRLTAPFVEPVRITVQQHQLVLAQARTAIEAAQTQNHQIAERLQRLAHAQRFLYPPREYFVVGYKPGPRPAQHAESGFPRRHNVDPAATAGDLLPANRPALDAGPPPL
jgi:SAM-dependent methyltransferase